MTLSPHHSGAHSAPLRGVVAIVWAGLMCAGCQLQGIPLQDAPEDTPDQASPDLGMSAPDASPVMVCAPAQLECIGDNIRACNNEGTDYTITPCPMDTQCSAGACVVNVETCDQSDTVALSHDTLFFDAAYDAKPTTNVLTLTNCSDQPLRIQKASIVSALRASSTQNVFDWSPDSATLQGSVLAPGDTLPIKIELRPRDPSWREDGTLYLSLQGAESLITRTVPLRTNTWCLGAPPIFDMGDLQVDAQSDFSIPLHNCGTRALLLSGSTLTDAAPLTGKPWVLKGSERPLLIAPGSTHRIELSITPETTGALTGQVDLTFSPRDQAQLAINSTRVPFIARSIRSSPDTCTPSTRHRLLIDGMPADAIARLPLDPYIVSLATRQPDGSWGVAALKPDETIRFEATTTQSARPPFLVSNETLFGPHALLLPYVPGTYTVRALRHFEEAGEARCEVTTLSTSFAVYGDYSVSLEWYGIDDPVRDDIGVGHGIDLDLHVRFISKEGTVGAWRSLEDSCDASSSPRRCAMERGYILNDSQSGSSPELLALYKNARAARAEIGVHVRNMSGFSEACATVHIWGKDGELLAKLPFREGAATQCAEQPAKAMQQTDNFWLAGTLDLDQGEFDDATAFVKSRGFPDN